MQTWEQLLTSQARETVDLFNNDIFCGTSFCNSSPWKTDVHLCFQSNTIGVSFPGWKLSVDQVICINTCGVPHLQMNTKRFTGPTIVLFSVCMQQCCFLCLCSGCMQLSTSDMLGAVWNCCHLGASSVYTIQPCTSQQCHYSYNNTLSSHCDTKSITLIAFNWHIT